MPLPKRRDGVTAKDVQVFLEYTPDTGAFVWRSPPKSRPDLLGRPAGCLTSNGYISIRVCGTGFQAHRLAWLITTGKWPTQDIDHIDGNRANNRIGNLREASRSENMQNVHQLNSNTSGFQGVSWSRRNRKWKAQIKHQGVVRHIGLFDLPDEAHQAYLQEKSKLHTFNPSVRSSHAD